MQESYDNSEFSDVIVQSESQEIYAHKVILSKNEYFRNAIRFPQSDDSVIRIDETDVNAQRIIKYIYGFNRETPSDVTTLINVIELYEKYCVNAEKSWETLFSIVCFEKLINKFIPFYIQKSRGKGILMAYMHRHTSILRDTEHTPNNFSIYNDSQCDHIQRMPSDVGLDARDSKERNILMVLIINMVDIEHIKLLLDAEKINDSDCVDNTALIMAAAVNRLDVVQLLLSVGADVNHINSAGYIAANYALTKPDIFRVLIDAGSDITKLVTNKSLYDIYKHGDEFSFRIFATIPKYRKICDLYKIALCGNTAINYVRIMLEAGIDVNEVHGNATLLHNINKRMPIQSYMDIKQLLLKYSAIDEEYLPPLRESIQSYVLP